MASSGVRHKLLPDCWPRESPGNGLPSSLRPALGAPATRGSKAVDGGKVARHALGGGCAAPPAGQGMGSASGASLGKTSFTLIFALRFFASANRLGVSGRSTAGAAYACGGCCGVAERRICDICIAVCCIGSVWLTANGGGLAAGVLPRGWQ